MQDTKDSPGRTLRSRVALWVTGKSCSWRKLVSITPRIYTVLLRVRLALDGAAMGALSVGSTEQYVLIHTGVLL